MIVDREVVITGNFNFTWAAEESNAENVLIIRSKELAREYLENWEKHRRIRRDILEVGYQGIYGKLIF
jgi:phosphatidylserine/phosphatidylglycerophosphate/cardiolipin synthase-like enzyme